MEICYIGIGSNLGDRRENISSAIEKIKKLRDTRVLKLSRIMQTKPVGGPMQRDFLNGAIKIKTKLPPIKLLCALKRVERELGRKKTVKNGPRVIDLDILLYGDKIIERKELKIPHPRIFKRKFVIAPLLEII